MMKKVLQATNLKTSFA